jgi:hypothetical protein
LIFGVLLFALVEFMEFASAKQAGIAKPAWEVNLATNVQARSNITIRNQCKQTHSFTVVPTNVPYLQLPATPTVHVPGLSNQSFGVVFNTAGMRPGDYRGSVAVKCDTCGKEKGCSQENEILPVHLTIIPAGAIDTPTPKPTPTPTPRPEASPTATPTATPPISDFPFLRIQIMGQKVNDTNCNGKIDTNEPGLAGWTISATNTANGMVATTVTDANGFYYFNLVPGTYAISESAQAGWTQSMPGGVGTYTVTALTPIAFSPIKPGTPLDTFPIDPVIPVIRKDFANCKQSDDKVCATVEGKEAVCKLDGSGGYTYTFTVTNHSGKDVDQILLTPKVAAGITLSKQVFPLTTPLHNGQSTTITINIGNVTPGASSCFFLTLMTKDGPCCTVEVCPMLPDCCATATGKFACDPKGNYTGTFSIVNTSPNTIKHIYLYPPAGVTMSQTYFAVTLASGQSFTTPVITIQGAKPGKFCFRISMHTQDMKECCSVDVCIALPECGVHIGAASPLLKPSGAVGENDSRRFASDSANLAKPFRDQRGQQILRTLCA